MGILKLHINASVEIDSLSSAFTFELFHSKRLRSTHLGHVKQSDEMMERE